MVKRQRVRGNQWKRYLMMALTASTLFASTARAADPITDANVDAAVAAAKTPDDHQALAAFFTSKAEAALASAENHDKMAKAFGPSKSMAAHCRDLASAARRQANDYTALAKAQDALAKGTTGGKHKK